MNTLSVIIMAASVVCVNTSLADAFDPHQDAMFGRNMSAKQAEDLEAVLDTNPDDLSARTKLLGYYFMAGRKAPQVRAQRRKHVMWVIKIHPESELVALPYCGMDGITDPEAYVEAKKLWIEQTQTHPQDARVLGNAGAFFLIQERNLAQNFLEKAQIADPDNPKWADDLGQLYSMSDEKGSAAKSLEQYERADECD